MNVGLLTLNNCCGYIAAVTMSRDISNPTVIRGMPLIGYRHHIFVYDLCCLQPVPLPQMVLCCLPEMEKRGTGTVREISIYR